MKKTFVIIDDEFNNIIIEIINLNSNNVFNKYTSTLLFIMFKNINNYWKIEFIKQQ